MKISVRLFRLNYFIIFTFLLLTGLGLTQPAAAAPEAGNAITSAAMKMVSFNNDPKATLDTQAVTTLVDYVMSSKSAKETPLASIQETTGAYYEYDTKIGFHNFLQYNFSSYIPSAVTSPASIRYSQWNGNPGEQNKFPANWKTLAPDAKPFIIRGTQRDGITPDQTTGIYYEYDLKRTLILTNCGGKQVLISISKQVDVSEVGKKGFILGSDDDWNYLYTSDIGSARAGLGWVKSYIYDFFSVIVYVESGSSPGTVKAGVFQWIRAGWNGINFVKTEHVVSGMKRYSKNLKVILESPHLPTPKQIAATYKTLSALSSQELTEKYSILQKARIDLAVTKGKIASAEAKKIEAHKHTSKEQMLEALMVEYLKLALGKTALIGKQVFPLPH